MSSVDYFARVSVNRIGPELGWLSGKFLYVQTDTVMPGELVGFLSSKAFTESPSPDDRTSFSFQRSAFYWVCVGPYVGYTFLLTTDLSAFVVCGPGQESIKDAVFSPRMRSLGMFPLAPWATELPDVKPSDRRDGLPSS